MALLMVSYSTLFAGENASSPQFLNQEELLWLQHLEKPLKIGITEIPNQVLKTDDTYQGFSIDFFKEISSLLGIKFEWVYFNTWDAVLHAGEEGQIDIVFLAQKTQKRLAFYDFTDVVLTQQNKIITNRHHRHRIDIEELVGKKVAVVKNSAIAKYIKLNFPNIILWDSENELQSLQVLSEGKVDYTIAEAVRASYYIKENNINNLHVAGDMKYDYRLRIASRNTLPILNIILNKAVEHIPLTRKKSLALKWGYIKDKEVFFDKKLLMNLLIIALIILFFLIYLSLLNRRLKEAQKKLTEMNATLEKRVEIELEKNREKELIMLNQSRLAQMGQVLNMVAHQWRQPLNNLLLIAEVLIFQYEQNNKVLSSKEIYDFQEEFIAQVKQMSRTIDDFRDFFHPRKEKKVFDLHDVITNLLVVVKPVLVAEKITLRYDFTEKVFVDGYANEVAQAILNILYNAKDALLEHREENRHIEIGLTVEQEKVLLNILDNAGGIPNKILPHIFDHYFSTKGEKSGTGIGLYMSKMIIEEHMQGSLKVFNQAEGAMFQIELPRIV